MLPGDAEGDPRPRARAPRRADRRLHLEAARRAAHRHAPRRSRGSCPRSVALDLTARLELRGVDWSRTRAFAHPAENQGYVRLNLRGRERDGIVAPEDADALLDEITRGLLHVRRSRRRAGRRVGRARRRLEFAPGNRADLLPDLVVRWTDRPASRFTGLRSDAVRHRAPPRRRQRPTGQPHRGRRLGAGRAGHRASRDPPSRPPRLEDVAATAAALAGVTVDGLGGEPLLQRPARAR